MCFFRQKKVLAESGFFRGFTDCHSHLLPGVDDGVKTLEESLAILEEMERLGVRKVWLTWTVKPEPRIYEILLERYGLDPAETLFIDDRAANIAAAEGLGIAGYLFDHRNPAAACDELRRRLL